MTTQIFAPSELAFSIAVEEDERALASEFRDLSAELAEYVLRYIGGCKVSRQIAEICRFPEADDSKTGVKLWNETDHDGRIQLLEDRIGILHAVKDAFNEALEDKDSRDDFLFRLARPFPDRTLLSVICSFKLEYDLLLHKYTSLESDLRCIRIGAFNGFWSEHDPLY